MSEVMEQELAVIETKTAAEIFKPGAVDEILKNIEGKAKSIIFDPAKLADRKAAKSLAYKVSKSKKHLDDLGKELVSGWKEKAKRVDEDRKQVRDRLDALRDKIKAPISAWEAEQERLAEQKRIAEEITAAHEQAIAMNELFDREQAIARREAELKAIEEKRLAEAAAKKAAEEKAAREAQIAAEAAAKAKADAEAKAAAEQAAAERKAEEAIAAAKAAEEKAKRDAELAVERERQRVAAEQAAEEKRRAAAKAEAERKAANKAHQRKVNTSIVAALVAIGATEDLAKVIVTNLATGKIPNVTINY